MSPDNPLAALSALERRFDGPIPEPLREVVRCGSVERAEQLFALAQARFFREMVTRQVAVIRARRRDGSAYPSLADDLALYRRGWRLWHRRVRTLGLSPTTVKTRSMV